MLSVAAILAAEGPTRLLSKPTEAEPGIVSDGEYPRRTTVGAMRPLSIGRSATELGR